MLHDHRQCTRTAIIVALSPYFSLILCRCAVSVNEYAASRLSLFTEVSLLSFYLQHLHAHEMLFAFSYVIILVFLLTTVQHHAGHETGLYRFISS